ncbi:mobile mystery protein B [Phenylobacterium sp.]|uniref:mobile mystery protein B n=1 Tax=Phenylobacterium sp. TaxID=1871053 RepID=UPI002FE0834F
MIDPLFDADDDANTPLTPAEREGLIPTYITTRAELNAAEQENIAEADEWAFTRRRGSILDVDVLMTLHRRMLRRVWKWAGKPRQTERNIGVPAHQIEVALHQLLDDVRYWVEHRTFGPDEIALRFHHRLVAIHPFPNGNGRHARLAADALAVELRQRRFTWGGASLVEAAETRKAYVRALQAADGHDMAPLLAFGRR